VLPAPRALLLDFGGVIVQSARPEAEEVIPQLAKRVRRLIGGLLTVEEVASELARADQLRLEFRASTGQEVTHEKLWREFVADLWPRDVREKVVAHATELTYAWADRPSWTMVDGIAELLEFTLGSGLPVAVVSNTRCGQAHRDCLERLGLTGAFAHQIYSDELGVCKPNPEMIRAAAQALWEAPKACWMVGDKRKDVECARQAGAGAAILMGDRPDAAEADPDARVADGHELLKLLKKTTAWTAG
jgi:N-acetyl-D-muramate 6-phosphate phosphatase